MEQLSQQVANLTTIIKRVVLQPPVCIHCFNSRERFNAQTYRSLADLFAQSCRNFSIDTSQLSGGMRFYWLPDHDKGAAIDHRLALRRTLRTEPEWESFLDEWNEKQGARLIVLYLVQGDMSPSLVQSPKPPSPPRMPLDRAEAKSEPASDHGLNARDSSRCVVCGYCDHVEAAHIIDKSRSELLNGAPDAPPIDDIRNLFQLCPNHHTSFDRCEWTLVEEKREEGTGFWLRTTPLLVSPSEDLTRHMQTFIRFSDPSPPAYCFILKQLGRFPVPCRVCKELFHPSAIWGHYQGKHKKRQKDWKGLPHLLPHITGCSCKYRCQNTWDLYCHVIAKHRDLLYR